MNEKPLSGKVIIHTRLQPGSKDNNNSPNEYFVELPNGELQPISEKDARTAIARSPQMARSIELLIELGKRREISSEGSTDHSI
ncbi:MAG: hypothetical protein IT328_23850 [Caldilineaceae bacterium]|nr:hypothetical protein [Caldilineaceae bacterium]